MAPPAKIRLPARAAERASQLMNGLRHARNDLAALLAATDAEVIVSISGAGRWQVTDAELQRTLRAWAEERTTAAVADLEAQLAEMEIEVEPDAEPQSPHEVRNG